MTKLNSADAFHIGASAAASAVYVGATKVWPVSSVPTFVTSGFGYQSHYGDPLVTSAFDVAAGSLICLVITYSDNASYLTTVTDSAGNVYTKGKTATGTTDYNITTTIYYCLASAAKVGNVVTLRFPGSEPELACVIATVFSPATWSYDATGSAVVAHVYAAGPISSPSMATASKGVFISAASVSYNGPTTQSFYFNPAETLITSIQHGATTGVGYKFNAAAVGAMVYQATSYNVGGAPTDNISGNALFASFTYT